MFTLLRGLLGSVARGLMWTARLAVMIPAEIGESMFTAIWRQLFPPPAPEAESAAEVLREVAGMIAGREANAAERAERETRPTARAVEPEALRKSRELALRYTTAVVQGTERPSLKGVGMAMYHRLKALETPAQAAPLHRDLIKALGLDDKEGWWTGRPRVLLAPGLDHDGLTPCPT